jgi:hypothetical protein
MTRLIIIAVLFAGACIALIIWIASGAQERTDLQQEVLEDGGKSLARNRSPSGVVIPKYPRTASHVLLSLDLPEGDPRRSAGGATIFDLRGNGVAYRRSALANPTWSRHVIATPKVETILADAAALPDAAEGYTLVTDLGSGPRRRVTERAATDAFLATAEGKASAWTPDTIRLLTSGPSDGATDDHVAWPDNIPGLQSPDHYVGTGADFRAPKHVMERLLQRLLPDQVFKHEDSLWRVESVTVAFPP